MRLMKLNFLALLLVLFLFQTAFAAEPSLGKLGINFHLVPHFNKAEWTWTPSIRFRIYGPIASSDVVWVEYTLPNGKPFVKVQCENISAISDSENIVVNDCGFRQEDDQATNLTGLFGFQIKLANELNGTNKRLFSGKFNVSKNLYNPEKLPDRTRQFYYYVDHDWRLPMAYLGVFYGDLSNDLFCELWLKNRILDQSKVLAFLMYNGKQVAEASASFTIAATPPETPQYSYQAVQFHFNALVEKPPSDSLEGHFKLYQNPGEYEIKVLRDGKLARTLKFSIGNDGRPVDANGLVKQNSIAKEGALVPVQVLGDADGVWNKTAWKTEAFWNNPVPGLSIP
ncbi:MAG: hypothetical protein ABI596_17605 [Pyrinomonadaceae bacterium]